MEHYTRMQIADEIAVLRKTFPMVRLVNPISCRVMELSYQENDLVLSPGAPCFSIWDYPFQCANCISARVKKTNCLQSKYEFLNGNPFHVTARPVCVDDMPLVLELLTPVTSDLRESSLKQLHLPTLLKKVNRNMLHDSETTAFNRSYLSEHIPNLFFEAKEGKKINAAFIRIQNLDSIIEDFGNVAALGLICGLYDALTETFLSQPKYSLLFVRYNYSTFFVIEKQLLFSEFKERITTLRQTRHSEHILFSNARMPLQLSTSCVCLNDEKLFDEDTLFSTLESRMESDSTQPHHKVFQ